MLSSVENLHPTAPASRPASGRCLLAALLLGWLIACSLEFGLLPPAISQQPAGTSVDYWAWLRPLEPGLNDSAVWFWFMPVGIISWLAWKSARSPSFPSPSGSESGKHAPLSRRDLLLAAGAGLVHLLACLLTDVSYGSPYPAYHDEYSYLFQAQTLLAGRWTFPTAPVPELFDQMHVVNVGVFASRYFPGTGLWLAPFVAVGLPEWGMPAAGALTVLLLTLTGIRIAGAMAGAFTGFLLALSPGAVIFHSLMLSHAPTLLGLSLFLLAWTYLDDVEWNSSGVAYRAGLVVGAGLAFAMLCRPLTAAAVALPYGLIWFARGKKVSRAIKVSGTLIVPPKFLGGSLGMATALAVGFAVLGIQNKAITGQVLLTPYSLYTRTYTPRHVYGFNNVERGSTVQAPRAVRSYEDWAENLTVPGACANLARRVISSLRWTIGLIPGLVLLGAACCCRRNLPDEAWLWLASAVSLHLVYFPYWYDGIMHWHYAYESVLPLTLGLGTVLATVIQQLTASGRKLAAIWCWLGAGLVPVCQYFPPSAPQPALYAKSVSELRFAKSKYQRVYGYVEQSIPEGRALVIVRPDPADRHMDFVVNTPSLDSRILYARERPDLVSNDQVRRLYPDRALYLLDIPAQKLVPLTP